MARFRHPFFLLLTVAAIALLVYRSWLAEDPHGALTENGIPEVIAEGKKLETETLNEKIFLIRSKLLVGGKLYFEAETKDVAKSPMFAKASEDVTKTFEQLAASSAEAEETSVRMLEQLLVAAHFLKLPAAEKQIAEKLASRVSVEMRDPVLVTLLEQAGGNTTPGSIQQVDVESLRAHLGWFADLFLARGDSQALPKPVRDDAIYTFKKFMVLALFGVCFALVSFVTFVTLTTQIIRKKFVFQFSTDTAPALGVKPEFGLEIFALYLWAMIAGSLLLETFIHRGLINDPLLANVALITSTLVVLLWPRIFGVPFNAARRAFGLFVANIRSFCADLTFGPLVYVASWTVLFTILVLYSLLMSALHVDITKGTHPIVPILLANDNQRTLFLVVFLAVVLAPIVEEIMFRGALFTYLRSRLGPKSAILVSAVVFASIHPQGPIGLVPLTSIGLVLGFIRQWRNSLLPCMLCHACFNAGTLLLFIFFFKS